MDRIDGNVGRELRRLGAPAGMAVLVEAWPALVGETIARNAWPGRISRDRTLHVNVSSSTWAFELGQLAPTILERLAAALGEDCPRALRFVPGPLPEPAAVLAPEQSAGAIEPDAEHRARAEKIAAAIDDVELRETVARAAALSLSRAASGRSFC